jgi:hypothetical protein
VNRPSASNVLQKDLWNRRARLMGMLRRTPKSRHVVRRSACLSQHFNLARTTSQTTQRDRWARLAGMSNGTQHETPIATLGGRVASIHQARPCPSSRTLALSQWTNQSRQVTADVARICPSLSVPQEAQWRLAVHKVSTQWKVPVGCNVHESWIADSALGNRIEVWLGLGQLKILRK